MERWHRSFPARQLRARPLACFALAFLDGLAVAARWTPPVLPCLAACAGLAGIAAIPALRRRGLAALLLLLGAALGMARMSLALEALPEVETRYSVRMTGRVDSEPFTNPDTGRVIAAFHIETAEDAPSDLRVRLYLRGDETALAGIAYGQRLSLTGHIWANDPVTNPHEFNFGNYLRRNGMSAIATAKIEDVEILAANRDARSIVIAVRQAVGRRIDALFPDNAPMVRALVLGDRSLLSEEQREHLNATGTAHLIAISGLHVTLLAFALAFVFARFMPARAARLAALGPLLLYGALTGFSPSFIRALAMYAILSFAPLPGLPSDGVTRLCAAMLAGLLIQPLAIADAGFILSYSASAGILLLMPPIQALFGLTPASRRDPDAPLRQRLARRAGEYFADLLCASLAAQLMSLPAVIAFFGVQSVVSAPFNLICVPLCMGGYMLAMAALLVSAFCLPLGALCARLPDALFTALLAVTRFSAALPVTTVRIGRYPTVLIAAHGVVAVAASDLSRVRMGIRKFLPVGLLGVAALSSMVCWASAWRFSVTFLDAGQADCAVVRTRGHTYVFDAGDTYTPAADYLSATCLRLDGVILSHPHQDHAGGLTDILTCFTPGAIYVPEGWFAPEGVSPAVTGGIELAADMGVPVVELRAGDAVPLSGDCEMTVWSPQPGATPAEVNDMSLLTLVSAQGHAVLFTGDLTMNGEPETVPDCDILKVAHHGANNATSVRFLAAATPEYAVISVGENSFGHPGDEALARLANTGAALLSTDRLGAITFTLRNGQWHIKTYLEAPDDLE